MIHQFIFGAPKPGWSAAEFQDYWLNVHAVKYASRIKQIRKYMIDKRVPSATDLGVPALPHQGIAEIWLANEEEQLASLQSEEFLLGARADEPNWAAFWQAIVLDTTAHEIPVATGPAATGGVKVTTLLKRRPGMSLADYRDQSLTRYAPALTGLPGLTRHLHCHTRDGFYVFGEAAFDSVEQLWFPDVATAEAALTSPAFTDRVRPARAAITDEKYVFSLTTTESWVIGPDPR
jgi:hypothetical protein